jgi:formylglycine-generating enzyme required for sulfatase activity
VPANAESYPPVGPMVPCKDGFVYTAPVAHFKPNAFGVHDAIGNVWTWTADVWNDGVDGFDHTASMRHRESKPTLTGETVPEHD